VALRLEDESKIIIHKKSNRDKLTAGGSLRGNIYESRSVPKKVHNVTLGGEIQREKKQINPKSDHNQLSKQRV
jgi:hypothetical protein